MAKPHPPKHLLLYPTLEEAQTPSFESFQETVSDWKGMFFEMDGSFVWAISHPTGDPETKEQLDGMVYDRAGRIEYLELKGNITQDDWLRIVCALIGGAGSKTPTVSARANSVNWESLSISLKVYDVTRSTYVLPKEAFA